MSGYTIDRVNLACGLLFIAVGAVFGYQSVGMELGTALRMGPGYFPLVLSGVLMLLGVVVILQSIRAEGEALGAIAWRGIFLILPAPIFFGLTVRGLGFLPAIFCTALIASFASTRMNPLMAVLISAGVTVFSYLAFIYALGLPFRLVGPWLAF
ncbi:tripartite tricarboxylate transporter TctB family protein [Chelativorans sp.]|uniref:tripartite tricarboxylate transporter TctB family protein n=1 Tax=Chelativorans sp. TaxID=2203393 RepID=UPI0028128801|nr:tripartite tricarboxylate transporter TctB family protein [Chelativorans sp.]